MIHYAVVLFWTRDQPNAETSASQHWQETGIHAPGGIRTRNPSGRRPFDRAATGIS